MESILETLYAAKRLVGADAQLEKCRRDLEPLENAYGVAQKNLGIAYSEFTNAFSSMGAQLAADLLAIYTAGEERGRLQSEDAQNRPPK